LNRTKSNPKKSAAKKKRSVTKTKKSIKIREKEPARKLRKVVTKKKTGKRIKNRRSAAKKIIIKGQPGPTDKDYLCKDLKSRWWVVELDEDADLEQHAEYIERLLISIFGPDVEYFLPVCSERIRDKSSCFVFFEGYFFIKIDENVRRNISRLRGELIKGLLSKNGKYCEVTGKKINSFKKDMRSSIRKSIPRKGQIIIPKIGTFSNMNGTVIAVDRRKFLVTARFKKTSRVVDAPINVINIKERLP